LHYAANGNWDASGVYLPATAGFNLADIGSPGQLAELPAGTQGLVWVGQCDGVTAAFTQAITPYIGDPRVFGFYLMDEPDPTGQWNPQCPQSNIKAEADWIHANDPKHKSFVLIMNMASSSSPSYVPSYTPANSDVDLYGLDPYPCRTELAGCDLGMIDKSVAAANAAGIPSTQLVPVFQSFGYGTWVDDGGAQYALPTATQEQQILDRWTALLPAPAFDYAYSWGVQHSDVSLSSHPELQAVFAAHNAR
jgi:hypothetical protein